MTTGWNEVAWNEVVMERSDRNSLGESIRRFRKKIVSTKDGRKRKEMKGKTWITLSVKPKCSS